MNINQKKFKVLSLNQKGNTVKFRKLGTPSIKDRITQEVIRQLINPIFDAIFHENSFGFRTGRECHQALRQVLKYNQKGYNKLIEGVLRQYLS